MRSAVALVRLALAVAILVAIVATHIETASRVPVNVFNLYGYFTTQSNLIAAGVLIAAGATGLRRRRQGPALSLLRAVATTCIAIVGLVYATLLAPLGAEGGVPIPWANTILHIVSPIVIVIDWLVIGDRRRIPFRRIWLLLLYPAVWTIVVLIRGATDGWVPYPFLDPSQGYGVVTIYCVGILVVFVVVGLLVLLVSRFRGVLLRR